MRSHLLRQLATVRRKQRIVDELGGREVQRVAVGSYRACVSGLSARARAAFAQLQATASHEIYLPPEADVKPGDEIEIEGRTYEVRAVLDPAGPGGHREALCEERA